MKYLIPIISSVLTTVVMFWGLTVSPQFGSTILSTQTSDTLETFRTNVNSSLTNLNSTKIENSTTSVAAITTLSNLTTAGTLTSGTWNATKVGLLYGGTGTTTYFTGGLVFASSTSILSQASTTGALFWNYINNRLGVGTSAPTTILHVSNGPSSTTTVEFDAQVTTSKSCFNVRNTAGAATSFYVNTANVLVVESIYCR